MDITSFLNRKFNHISVLELLIFTLLGITLSFFLTSLHVGSYLNSINQGAEAQLFPLSIFFIAFWVSAYIVLKKIVIYLRNLHSSFQGYEFSVSDCPSKWIFQGNVRLDERRKCLYVTDSNSGCLLNTKLWKNFDMSFDFMFPNSAGKPILGVIFRAKSLADYFMIQINLDKCCIWPHVRMEGVWEPLNGGPKIDSQLVKKNEFNNCRLRVYNNKAELILNNSLVFEWHMPTNSDIKSIGGTELYNAFVPDIIFKKSYGKIGFRAFVNEGAFINNLKVLRLPSIF